MTNPLTNQQLDEIEKAVSAVAPEASPPLAPLADPFVVALAAKLNAIAPSPAPRSTGVHLALYEARAICAAGPLAQLREEHDALIAEIRRLRDALACEERLHGDTIDDRDRAADMADKLAYAVASEGVIGEHTADNSPWANALQLITPAAEVERLRAELATANARLNATARLAGRQETKLRELGVPSTVDVATVHAVPAAAETGE